MTTHMQSRVCWVWGVWGTYFTLQILLQCPHTTLACQPTTTVFPGTRPTEAPPVTAPPAPSPITQPPTQPPPAPSPITLPPPTPPPPTPPPTKAPTTTKVQTTTTTKMQTTTAEPSTQKPTTIAASLNHQCTTTGGKACVFPFLDTCITEKYEKCIFPFLYKGVSYDSCTTYHATGGKAWCATVTDGNGIMKRWSPCLPQTCTANSSPPKEHQSCADYEGSSWCATAVSGEGLVTSWDFCAECSAVTTSAPPTTTTTTTVVTGGVTVETQTTTTPSGAKSAEMGCGCNCGCKIPAEYVMAIVSGDVGALIQMAQGGQLPVAGRSLSRKKRPKLPRGSIADLTAAMGQAGLQLPVECGCDCSCDVQDVEPMVASPPPPAQSEAPTEPPPSVPPPTEVNSEAPTPLTTTTVTSTTSSTTTTSTEPGTTTLDNVGNFTAMTTFEIVTSNTTVSSVPSSTLTGVTANDTSADDLEEELEAASTKAELLMLDLVAKLEEIPELVRKKEMEDNGIVDADAVPESNNEEKDSLNRFFFFPWAFISSTYTGSVVINVCNNNNNNNNNGGEGGERGLNREGGERGLNREGGERGLNGGEGGQGLNRQCEGGEEGGERMSPARTTANRNVAVIEESLYKVNEISNRLPRAVSKESTDVGNNNNNNKRRVPLRSRHLIRQKNKLTAPLNIQHNVKNRDADPFEEELNAAATRVEAAMLKLVLGWEEVPEIVRKKEVSYNETEDVERSGATAGNRFFFHPWGFVSSSSSITICNNNNNNNNNNNGGGERTLDRQCEGGEEAAERMSPARLTAVRTVKVMEESLFKINLQIKKLPRAIASKSTAVPEETEGLNNNNNNNNNN